MPVEVAAIVSLAGRATLSCLEAAASNSVGRAGEDMFRERYGKIRDRLEGLEPPQNHDLQLGIYRAAIQATLATCLEKLAQLGIPDEKPFWHFLDRSKKLRYAHRRHGVEVKWFEDVRVWCYDELERIRADEEPAIEELKESPVEADAVLGFSMEAEAQGDRAKQLRDKLIAEILSFTDQLELRVERPEAADKVFEENWPALFDAFVQEEHKSQPKFKAILTGMLLSDLRAGQEELENLFTDEINALEERLCDRFDNVVSRLKQRRLYEKYHGVSVSDAMQDRLDNLTGGQFIGREGELARLDIHVRDTGAKGKFLLVTGPEDAGKSALLVEWAKTRHKQKSPLSIQHSAADQYPASAGYAAPFVAIHLFSANSFVLASPREAYTGLLLQLAEYYDLEEDELVAGTYAAARDTIIGLLKKRGGRKDEPLVIVIDAINEAESGFSPPIPVSDWPEHVYLIASSQREAVAASTASNLEPWRKLDPEWYELKPHLSEEAARGFLSASSSQALNALEDDSEFVELLYEKTGQGNPAKLAKTVEHLEKQTRQHREGESLNLHQLLKNLPSNFFDPGERVPREVTAHGTVEVAWAEKRPTAARTPFDIYGRDQIAEWEKELRSGELQMLTLWGEGGIGKSTILEELWHRLKPAEGEQNPTYDLGIAVSMEDDKVVSAEAIGEAVFEKIDYTSAVDTPVPSAESRLVSLLKEKRSLVVIDNFESAIDQDGTLKEECADLEQLINVLKRPNIDVTTILACRELPEILRSRPLEPQIQSEEILGLDSASVISAVLQALGLESENSLITEENRRYWEEIVGEKYLQGNPFVCIHVAKQIDEDFDGGPKEWIERAAEEDLPTGAKKIYEWHWERLENRPKEREILLWLAINRGPMTKKELRSDLWSEASRKDFRNSLRSLRRRFSIRENAGLLFVHSYITEFSVDRVIDLSTDDLAARLLGEHARDRVIDDASDLLTKEWEDFEHSVEKAFENSDLRGPTGRVLIDHCLVKASAPAPLRAEQHETFVEPVLRKIRTRRGRPLSPEKISNHLKNLLKLCSLRGWGGYLAGNLLTLLKHVGGGAIRGVNAPRTSIRQLDLRGASVQKTNLEEAILTDVYFTQNLGEVRALALSPPGSLNAAQRYIAAGDDIGAVTVWRAGDETPLHKHLKHDGTTIRAVAFSPDGKHLASADKAGRIWLWRNWKSDQARMDLLVTSRGTPVDMHEGSTQLRALAFTRQGELITAAESPSVWLHDLQANTSRRIFDLNVTREASSKESLKRVHTLHVGGEKLYAGTKLGRVYEIPLYDRGSTYEFIVDNRPSHADSVFAVTVSPDGSLLATGGVDGTVRLWSLSTHELQCTLEHGDEVFSLAFTPDSGRLISGGEDARIAIWNMEDFGLERRLKEGKHSVGHSQRVRALVAGNDPEVGALFVSGGFDRKLIQWTEDGEALSVVEGYSNGLMSLSGAENGLLVGAYGNGNVSVWIPGIQHSKSQVPENQAPENQNLKTQDARAMYSSPSAGEIEKDGARIPYRQVDLHEHSGPAYCVASSPVGDQVVSGGRDGRLVPRRLDAEEAPDAIHAHDHWIWSVDVSPSGNQIASCSEDGRVLLWDHDLRSHVLCQTGAEDNAAYQVPVSRGLSHPDRVRTVRYHPDPELNLLASGGYDKAVRFWDAADGTPRGVLEGADDWVYALAFSTCWFAAGWGKGVVRIWNVGSLLSSTGPWSEVDYFEWAINANTIGDPSDAGSILCLLFLSDHKLLTAGDDSVVRVWERHGETWEAPQNVFSFQRHNFSVTALSALSRSGESSRRGDNMEGILVASGDASGKGWVWHPESTELEPVSFAPLLPYQDLNLSGVLRKQEQGLLPIKEGERRALESLGARV